MDEVEKFRSDILKSVKFGLVYVLDQTKEPIRLFNHEIKSLKQEVGNLIFNTELDHLDSSSKSFENYLETLSDIKLVSYNSSDEEKNRTSSYLQDLSEVSGLMNLADSEDEEVYEMLMSRLPRAYNLYETIKEHVKDVLEVLESVAYINS